MKVNNKTGLNSAIASLMAFPLGIAGALSAPAMADNQVLEEIIVTAQRRGESLQSTPITVNAVTGEMAIEKGILSTTDLQLVTPGLVYADSGIGQTVYLRGVGTQNSATGEEMSVATYIDGVYHSALPAGFSNLGNIERVEVLKGPQGTLFGRNATGGLIHILTKNPSSTPELNVSATVGDYATYGAQIYATGPLGDSVAANFSGNFHRQDEGWGKNVFNGREVYETSNYSLRAKLLWTVSEDTEVLLNVDASERDDAKSAGAIFETGAGIGGQQPLGDFYDIQHNLHPRELVSNGGASLRIQHDLSWSRFTSTTAYRTHEMDSDFDSDRTAFSTVDALIQDESDQLTQEFQLQSLDESAVKWIVGIYYFDWEADLTKFQLSGAGLAAAGGVLDRSAFLDTKSWAGYGQVTMPVTERTNVTVGARYTEDERDLKASDFLPAFGLTTGRVNTSDSWGETTWRLAVDHSVTDDMMVFASYSRGFKSGVYNMFAPADPPVEPETLDAFEVGMKSEFLDNRLRLNVSGFYYKYEDIQLNQAVSGANRLFNAAEATVQGLDMEVVALVGDGLSLDMAFQVLDTEYDDFANAPNQLPRPATCTPFPQQLPGPRTGGNLVCFSDASGNQLIRAPEFSGSVGARYEWPTAMGNYALSLHYAYTDGFPYEVSNRLQQDAHGVLNGQLGWRSPSEKYGLRLWGRNLADEEYFTNMASSTADTFVPAAPRTFGITVDMNL